MTKDLRRVRQRLMDELTESTALVARLSTSMQEVSDAREGSNVDDEHDPEGSTIAFERSQLGAVLGRTRDRIVHVRSALTRLDAGTYGLCAVGGEPIPDARLDAMPWAQTCVTHAD
jgi:RNA polymerase-binding transcription factor DksA